LPYPVGVFQPATLGNGLLKIPTFGSPPKRLFLLLAIHAVTDEVLPIESDTVF
jgi:hypothetical protein